MSVEQPSPTKVLAALFSCSDVVRISSVFILLYIFHSVKCHMIYVNSTKWEFSVFKRSLDKSQKDVIS